MKKIILSGLLGGVFFMLAGGFWFNTQLEKTFSVEQGVNVKKGDGFFKVLSKINSKEKISMISAKLFLKYGGLAKSLKSGEYKILKGESLKQVLFKFSKGKVVLYKVTIPEGYNVYEISDLLFLKKIISDKKSFLKKVLNTKKYNKKLKKSSLGLEGYLYPSTYNFPKGMSLDSLVDALVDAHEDNYNRLIKKYDKKIQFTKNEIIILASVVEKETGASWERPLIASVFLNRLKKKMRLQSDPTTIYGQWKKIGKRLFNIRKRHLQEKNDYNTYTVRALPIGPISNPGTAAIEAVLNPKKSNFLYFVSRNDGTHYFSKTYKEHLSAVQRFQLSKQARAGKSWRNFKNN